MSIYSIVTGKEIQIEKENKYLSNMQQLYRHIFFEILNLPNKKIMEYSSYRRTSMYVWKSDDIDCKQQCLSWLPLNISSNLKVSS